MRPMLTFDFFEAMAAMMSVPPDEPLCTKAVPMPRPQSTPPMVMFINGSLVKPPSNKGVNMPTNTEIIVAP